MATALLLDEDLARLDDATRSLRDAGWTARGVTGTATFEAALSEALPDVVVVFAELRAPLVSAALTCLTSRVDWASCPVVLVTPEPLTLPGLSALRAGVVAALPAPWDLAHHPAALGQLLTQLPQRPGVASVEGPGTHLAQWVDHLRRAFRSGVLTVTGSLRGRVAFVKGILESAEAGGVHGPEALAELLRQPHLRWTFTEVTAGPAEGASGVIELQDGPPVDAATELTAAPPTALPILLVDDDEELRRMFGTLFNKRGFGVRTAADGIAGFEAALKTRFEAVVVDLSMPRMDGWGLLQMLRSDYRTREVPVAFLSCHDDYRETLRAHSVDAQAFLSKGTRLDALVEQVRQLLAPRERVRALLKEGADTALPVGAVGPQWLLRELAVQKATGHLEAKDAWAAYVVELHRGAPQHASAATGSRLTVGPRALAAFIGSKAATGALVRDVAEGNRTLHAPLETLLADACRHLNDEERALQEQHLVHAERLTFDEALYQLYRDVGPSRGVEIARLLHEGRLAPRDVIAKARLSPLDVEETLRDLMRRGVLKRPD